MDNLIGKKLDGLYEVKELIGSGGMANVYKAVMLGRNGPVPAGTVVAVKVLRQEYTHDPELVRRFKNESKAISLLNHPNIVKVYDVSVNDQLQYIVMEYVDGMTLREYLNERGGKLTSRETVHFISQILKALEHAHANGVVHRDIKPQNIMLLDNGQLRMMDFGIARISRAENQIQNGKKAMGSVHYISPEQAKGEEDRPQERHLLRGRHDVRDALGQAALRRRRHGGGGPQADTGHPEAAGRACPGRAAGPRPNYGTRHGEVAGQPVFQRHRDAGSTGRLRAGPLRHVPVSICKGRT